MGRSLVTSVNPEAILLENILNIMEHETFCKDTSAKIVGGTKRLLDLIAAGEIKAVKKSRSQNGKWSCNAAQVLRHCRNTRRKKSKP